MALKFVNAIHSATDDDGEVLVVFERENGKLRNVLLRAGSDFAIDQADIDALKKAEAEPFPTAPADDASDDEKSAFAASCAAVNARIASAQATFAKIAEEKGVSQATKEDTPPEEKKVEAAPNAAAASDTGTTGAP